uniref:AB hydrolase-1 domain-containing protein n=1 Tax=Steinernema glaseri TaxID=37863 RepID=A0A1I8ASI6_9BILA
PQINKFYVFDLSPEKSLARFCLRSTVQTFIVSWRNPNKSQREWGLSTYIDALKEAVDVVLAITGSKDLNMLGACSGGITCTALVGHYAALGEKKVNALTLLVSVLDTTLDTQNNPLVRPGALEVCGTPIDLSQVTTDIFSVAGTNDHITPWKSCYKSAQLFGGKVEFLLSNSGHIQSILNPPGNPK